MSLLALQLANTELTTSFATQYTVGVGKTTRLMETVFCNTSGATRTVTMCFVESGDSADEATPGANAVMKEFDLPAGLPVALTWNTFFNAGDLISAKASGDGVVLIASGIEETL